MHTYDPCMNTYTRQCGIISTTRMSTNQALYVECALCAVVVGASAVYYLLYA